MLGVEFHSQKNILDHEVFKGHKFGTCGQG
jgi:hypothetical protein